PILAPSASLDTDEHGSDGTSRIGFRVSHSGLLVARGDRQIHAGNRCSPYRLILGVILVPMPPGRRGALLLVSEEVRFFVQASVLVTRHPLVQDVDESLLAAGHPGPLPYPP